MLELTYTTYSLYGFGQDCGYTGDPFRWDEYRRYLLRCELDAAYFHLYGVTRDDVGHIMNAFGDEEHGFIGKEIKQYGEYRTKRVILEIYDEMQQAITSGRPYQTRLDPPPANGWTPPELPEEKTTEISVSEPMKTAAREQAALFAWHPEDPQLQIQFDDEI